MNQDITNPTQTRHLLLILQCSYQLLKICSAKGVTVSNEKVEVQKKIWSRTSWSNLAQCNYHARQLFLTFWKHIIQSKMWPITILLFLLNLSISVRQPSTLNITVKYLFSVCLLYLTCVTIMLLLEVNSLRNTMYLQNISLESCNFNEKRIKWK